MMITTVDTFWNSSVGDQCILLHTQHSDKDIQVNLHYKAIELTVINLFKAAQSVLFI